MGPNVKGLEFETGAALVTAPAVDAEAEALLDLGDDGRHLPPRAACRLVRRLGPKPGDLDRNVVLDG